MSTPQTWLAGLLAVQLLFAGGLFAKARHHQLTSSQQVALLELHKETIDKIELKDGEGLATLQKTENGWALPNVESLPIDKTRVEDLLTSLANLKQGWPVATTESARQRFEVADDKFRQLVKLYSGEKLVAELYLGASPGFQKVHVRKPKEDSIYVADLNSFQVPCKDMSWLNKRLLSLKEPSSLKWDGFELKKSGKDWTLAQLPEGRELDPKPATQIANTLRGLQVLELAQNPPEGEPEAILEATGADGTFRYEFRKSGDKRYLKRSDLEQTFTLHPGTYKELTEISLEQLLKKK